MPSKLRSTTGFFFYADYVGQTASQTRPTRTALRWIAMDAGSMMVFWQGLALGLGHAIDQSDTHHKQRRGGHGGQRLAMPQALLWGNIVCW